MYRTSWARGSALSLALEPQMPQRYWAPLAVSPGRGRMRSHESVGVTTRPLRPQTRRRPCDGTRVNRRSPSRRAPVRLPGRVLRQRAAPRIAAVRAASQGRHELHLARRAPDPSRPLRGIRRLARRGASETASRARGCPIRTHASTRCSRGGSTVRPGRASEGRGRCRRESQGAAGFIRPPPSCFRDFSGRVSRP